jgi:hypothetical protein
MMVCAWCSISFESGHAQRGGVNTESLVATINRVRVLAFDTDRPVREVRALVDGKVVGTDGWRNSSKGIKIAVIRRSGDVLVEMQVGNEGGFLRFPFSENVRANVAEPESYGPGRKLGLADWVEVFSLKQVLSNTQVLATLQIEVR